MGLAWPSLVALPLAGALSVGQLPDVPEQDYVRTSWDSLEQDYMRSLPTDHDDPDYSRTRAETHAADLLPEVFCKEDDWTMPSFRDDSDATPPLAPPWVVIRGGTFRSGVKAQEESFCSVRKHVIQPLMAAHALSSMHVHLCVRPHEDNTRILKHAEKLFGVPRRDVSLREVSKEQEPTQQRQFLSCLADVPSNARFALIMRPDLVFMESLDLAGPLSPNMFYFQWNLFQMCNNKEMGDQMHLVGGNLIDQLKKKMDTSIKANISTYFREDGQRNHDPTAIMGYHDEFHMMYWFVKQLFGAERLGYLNHYPTQNCIYHKSEDKWHKLGFCRQRGNGEAAHLEGVNTNPLFVYDRHVAARGLSTCDGDDINIRKSWMVG